MADRMKSEKIKSAITSIKTTLEKRRQNESDDAPWIKQVAVLSGTLAALTGFLTVRVTTLTNDAIYESNQAILAQTQSSDHWAEYQAASIKSRIVETALISSSNLSRAKREELTATAQDFRDRQPELKKAAIEKSLERDDHLHSGYQQLAQKNMMNYASVAAQIGIALASAAALVRLRKVFYLSVAIGVAAIGLTAYTLALQYGLTL